VRFRDDGHDRGTFKRLFHSPEHIVDARNFERDQSIHGKPEAIETRAIERTGFGARERALDPEHMPVLRLRKRRECERKSCRRAGMEEKSGAQLVQCAKRKAAPERIVDCRNAQAQRTPAGIHRSAGGIVLRDGAPQLAERIGGWCGTHG
jgi:hypothetical protein